MNFHLNYTPPPSDKKIDHRQKIMMLGSCFAENIGQNLSNYKFDCLLNPNGIVFNPISIVNAFRSYIQNIPVPEAEIVQNNESYYSLLHHGDFHSRDKKQLIASIDNSTRTAHEYLKKTDWIIFTLGSSFIYRYLKTGAVAANCHKLPQSDFRKELLKPTEIVQAFNEVLGEIRKINPSINILFTVSPVKYLRDGVIENARSKAILIESTHEIVENNSNCHYFPAYELIADDLRDYRFYKEDMAHPNDAAIKYVWEKFSETYFSEETKNLNTKIKEILQAAGHRPINEASATHTKFKENYLKRCEILEKEHSFLNFEKEKKQFGGS